MKSPAFFCLLIFLRIVVTGLPIVVTGLPVQAQSMHGKKALAAESETDICVYGGTAAGVIAAYTAKMQGKRVLLVEPGRHLGGMTSGGLGYTDIGNKYVVTGLARDFYRRSRSWRDR